MEYLDVVDKNGNPTGEIVERSIAHKEGIPHHTSHVWICRKKNNHIEILLQKRSADKDSYPGMYDISSAGHIPAGVSYEDSAVRELQEELHVNVDSKQLIYIGFRSFYVNKIFHGERFIDDQYSNVYLLWYDQDTFIVQKEEIESVLWMEFKACKQAVIDNTIKHCVDVYELELIEKELKKEGIDY